MSDLRSRASWDQYFLELAGATASRSNCVRRQVGAVLVQKRRLRGAGYNGPPSGYGHCDAGACPRASSAAAQSRDYDNCVAIHAEANALLHSDVTDRDNASLYTTDAPCFSCAKLIANSGVSEVVAGGGRYDGWDATRAFLLDCGIRVRLLDGQEHAPQLPFAAT